MRASPLDPRPRDALLLVGVVAFVAWTLAMLSPYAFGGWHHLFLAVATLSAVMRIIRGPPVPVTFIGRPPRFTRRR